MIKIFILTVVQLITFKLAGQLSKNQNKDIVYFGTVGYNYGYKTSFNNSNSSFIKLDKSFTASIGLRKNIKASKYIYELSAGFSSYQPWIFVAKENFSNPTPNDINSIMPAEFEFLNINASFYRADKIVNFRKKIPINIILGVGIQYLPKFTDADISWSTTDGYPNAQSEYIIYFDEKFTNGSQIEKARRGISPTAYIGLNAEAIFLKTKVQCEAFFKPSFRPNIRNTIVLAYGGNVFYETQNFYFSSFGFKFLFAIPKSK